MAAEETRKTPRTKLLSPLLAEQRKADDLRNEHNFEPEFFCAYDKL